MAAPARVPLGAPTGNSKWWLDVNTGTSGAPVWVGVHGISEFEATTDPNLEDDSDFDSQGWGSKAKTGDAWMLNATLQRKTTEADPEEYDPGQEFLRAAGGAMGTSNVVEVRWYEMTDDGPRVESYRGKASVTWKPQGGARTALSTVALTLSGRGARVSITHPDA